MDALDGQTKEVDFAYEPDYEITDAAFFEPFVVMKPVGREGFAWWNGPQGRGKVEKLFQAFKTDLTVNEACISAGISRDQYVHFYRVHPLFSLVKSRCKGVLSIAAKQGLAGDIVHPEGFRTRQWYLERRQPQIYGRDIGAYTPPPSEAATKVTAEAFLDDKGEMIVSRQTAERLKKKYGDSETPSE